MMRARTTRTTAAEPMPMRRRRRARAAAFWRIAASLARALLLVIVRILDSVKGRGRSGFTSRVIILRALESACSWQQDLESGSVTGAVAVGGDGAAVGIDNRFADGEADAGAGAVAVAGGVAAVEAFEDVGQLGGQDAFAGVGDGDGDFVEFGAGGDGDASARWCVAERVGEQVGEYLSDAVAIGVRSS